MNLRTLLLTNNACYKTGKTITPKGIMVHSTGANNPYLKRYVGPNDGLLGQNQYNNHWNQSTPDGRQVCCHAFIGKLADGTIATYQTLPWNYRGWHCASGPKGSGNDTLIGFEICEDGLTDSTYFNKVYQEAVELCTHLCSKYSLSPQSIICHAEGHKQGIASNHADVLHWFPKHGKTMDSFREAVRNALDAQPGTAPKPSPEQPTGDGLYRVRKSWDNSKSQLGAFVQLSNAKAQADTHPGYFVFDSSGAKIYPEAGGYTTYTVAKGDSLWSIAQKRLGNGTRYKEIKALNGLTSDTIYAGQKLKIPQ